MLRGGIDEIKLIVIDGELAHAKFFEVFSEFYKLQIYSLCESPRAKSLTNYLAVKDVYDLLLCLSRILGCAVVALETCRGRSISP
jgi:hypothetical protein